MSKKKTPVTTEQDEAAGEVAKWVAEITLYDKESREWIERSKKIVKRYKDERSAREVKGRYNILWSNVQTLQPAIYAKNPVPNVERRFQDDDDLSRIAADVLERCVSYYVREDDFFNVMEQVVLDRLLPGRGTAWVRYVPNFKDAEVEGTHETKEEGFQTTDDAPPTQELDYEEVCLDYVNWLDFGHTWARTWEEVRAVWKKVYMTRSELVSRFGDIGKSVPLDYSPEKPNDTTTEDTLKKATVYEIWDKTSKQAIWIHKEFPSQPLDKRDDPLKLKGFFPTPKPFFATLANDSVIPIPDFIEYQDQAMELDELTGRIRSITKSIKVAGVYDASAEGIQRILAEGVENTLIPVEQYAVLGEKGGLKGVVEFLPLVEIMQALQGLYEARERVKQDLYEITGISDIVRGATNPNETLGAQELKGQYANLRLGRMQKAAERFSRDLVRIQAEIICDHFSIETIKAISGVRLMTEAEKQQFMQQRQMQEQQAAQQAQMAAAQAQQTGQQPQPPQPLPPIPDKMQEMLNNPSWEQVEQLLKNDSMRCFRIDVETESTIKPDQDAERGARVELLTAAGGFIQQMSVVQDPTLKPLLAELLMFGVRGFRVSRDIEGQFKIAMDKMQEQADAPPQPNPEEMKAKAEMERAQQEMQMEGQKMQAEMQKSQAELQMQGHTMQMEHQSRQAEIQLKMQENQQNLQFETARLEIDKQRAQIELQIKAKDLELKAADMQLRAAERAEASKERAKAKKKPK